jgi:hypothetical protein
MILGNDPRKAEGTRMTLPLHAAVLAASTLFHPHMVAAPVYTAPIAARPVYVAPAPVQPVYVQTVADGWGREGRREYGWGRRDYDRDDRRGWGWGGREAREHEYGRERREHFGRRW